MPILVNLDIHVVTTLRCNIISVVGICRVILSCLIIISTLVVPVVDEAQDAKLSLFHEVGVENTTAKLTTLIFFLITLNYIDTNR